MVAPDGDSMITEKTPLEIARETWPALEWTRSDGSTEKNDYYATWRGEGPGVSVAFVVRGGGKGWSVGTRATPILSGDLSKALVDLRDRLAAQHRAALAVCEPATADRFTCDRFTAETDPATGVTVRYDVHREAERRWEVVRPGFGHTGCASLSEAVSATVGARKHEEVRPTAGDLAAVLATVEQGHTVHCAKRLTWGDGECGCSKNRGGEAHTMNPPPEGWRLDSAARLWSALKGLTLAVTAERDGRPGLTVSRQLERADRTLEAHKTPYPVRVVLHAGEAVLMLTSAMDGSPAAIPVRWLASGYYIENSDGSVSLRVGKPGGLSSMWSVRESAAAIRETLDRLKAERGGDE